MTFPSLKSLLSSIKLVISRFPYELIFAMVGTIGAIINVEVNNIHPLLENWCIRIMMTANLGFLVSLSVTLFLMRSARPAKQMALLKTSAAFAAACLVFLINPMIHEADYMRFILLSLSGHLLVAYSGFINRGAIQGFWQFNKTLFLRFTTSVLYSTVLYLGLAAALGAMNLLFNYDFKSDTFLILWILIAGLFNTIFFLAGIPQDLPALDQDLSYPKGLKIFTQYVLIPLATVYVLILLAYEIKILLEWNLPKGYVSNLILGYAVFGILSLLLVYPIRDQEENKWIKTFANSFYFLMLPLLALLFFAVGTRVFNYGITEFRYFLVVLALWLLFIALYFLISRKQNIKLIPISLSILTLLSVYGPQSAVSVSRYSQQKILLNIFDQNNGFKSGKLIKVNKIAKDDAERALSTLQYLIRKHELTIFQPYVAVNLTIVTDSLRKVSKNKYNHYRFDNYKFKEEQIKWMENYLGLEKFSYRYADKSNEPENTYHVQTTQIDAVNVAGYDILIPNSYFSNQLTKVAINGIIIGQNYKTSGSLTVDINHEKVTFDINALMASLIRDKKLNNTPNDDDAPIASSIHKNSLPPSLLNMTEHTKSYTITYHINALSFVLLDSKKASFTHIEGYLLIKKNSR